MFFSNRFLEKTKIMRHHETHRRLRLLRIGNAGENRHQDNEPAITAMVTDPSYKSVK